jgi:DNA helicase-2/ATP-dependent DNA helicase PcrA
MISDTELKHELSILNASLNNEQREAAETTEGPVIVIAGAGTGKTKTLIHRVATLLKKGVPPTNIMVVTFTNKAASEIKERLEEMIGDAAEHVTAGTFHSIVYHKVLKKYPESAYLSGMGIDMDFCNIMDDADADLNIKSAMRDLSNEDVDQCVDNGWKAGTFKKHMSLERSRGRDVNEFISAASSKGGRDAEFNRIAADIWRSYNKQCRENNAIDFDDILLFADKMLQREPHIAKELSETFKYIMLDEAQDTNPVQMNALMRIAKHHRNFCIVGDEKQSIYSFRGASQAEMLGFSNTFQDAKMVVMRQNYRSLPKIVTAFNACADSMSQKLSDGQLRAMKEIPAEQARNPLLDKIDFVKFRNTDQEANGIVEAIKRDLSKGVPGKEIAILYRTRAQKNNLESKIFHNKILYHVVGDTALFKRAEVKDFMSMVKFLFMPWDSAAGLRFINATKFGVSVDAAKRARDKEGLTVHAFLKNKSEHRIKMTKKNPEGELSGTALKVRPIIAISDALRDSAKFQDSGDFIKQVIGEFWSLYLEPKLLTSAMNKGGEEEVEARTASIHNVLERIGDQLNSGLSMEEVIDEMSLMVEHDALTAEDMDRRVRLMTIHASKGLEFDNVYLIGADDQTMPGDTDDINEIEEARRLMYVAVTRAKHKVAISFPEMASKNGETYFGFPSRFATEISKSLNRDFIEYVPKEDRLDSDGKPTTTTKKHNVSSSPIPA